MQLPIVTIQSSITELIVNLRFMQKPLTVYWKKVTKTEMDGFHGRNIYQKHETSIKFKRNKPRVRSSVGQLCTTYKWQPKTVIVEKTKSLEKNKRYLSFDNGCVLLLFGDYLHLASMTQSAYVITLTCIGWMIRWMPILRIWPKVTSRDENPGNTARFCDKVGSEGSFFCTRLIPL